MSALARTDTSILGRWWWTVDRVLLGLVILLLLTGLVLSFAASPPVAERDTTPIPRRMPSCSAATCGPLLAEAIPEWPDARNRAGRKGVEIPPFRC